MSKNSLYKLSFGDRTAYQQAYESRFHDGDTIHLQGLAIGNHPAFLCQTIDLYQRIVSIERSDKKIQILCEKLPKVAIDQFAKRCLIDEIILTNKVEGVNSTRRDIGTILQNLSKEDKKKRFVGLMRKYEKLMKKEHISLETCQDVRQIYDDIFYEEVKASDAENLPDGQLFRRGSVSVYSKTDKEIHHGMFPEGKIIETMANALDFLNDARVELMLRIAVFHYLFGYIHPFYDGNGRMSRFISSYLLTTVLHPLMGYRISYTIKENISRYYKAFTVCNDFRSKGDLTPFAEMFLEIVDISARQLCDALEKREQQLMQYADVVPKLPFSEKKNMPDLYFILIQAALFSENGISRMELEQAMNLSYGTLRSKLENIPRELLIENRQGRQSFYMLNLEKAASYLSS